MPCASCMQICQMTDYKETSEQSLMMCFYQPTKTCTELKKDFVTLISRILVKYIPAFQKYQSLVPAHIEHERSKEMSQKSDIVSSYRNLIFVSCRTSLHVYMQFASIYIYIYICIPLRGRYLLSSKGPPWVYIHDVLGYINDPNSYTLGF